MVSKQETLKILKYAGDYEEKLILAWKDSFIAGVLADPGLVQQKKDRMIQIIKVVGIQSLQHWRTFIDWQLKISKSDSNEY